MKSPTYVNLAAVLVAVTLLAVACSSEATSGSEAADAQTGVVVKPAETAAPESGAPVTPTDSTALDRGKRSRTSPDCRLCLVRRHRRINS